MDKNTKKNNKKNDSNKKIDNESNSESKNISLLVVGCVNPKDLACKA